MNSLRRWLYRPKRSDTSLLAQFFYADEDLNMVAAELDSFDGRKDPERCTALVNQLRSCQDKVLTAIQNIMEDAIPGRRASRDFRCKFPDDVIQENLAGQLWFGAECLAAGSSIMNRETESASMRPLARALTKNLDSLRTVLREQCLKNINEYTDRIKEALIIFDKLFAEFELSYVSAMVPVKTMKEYDTVQEITVLFSETVQRALKIGLLTQDMIDEYDPALMFTIPRLAIVSGLVVFREGPLNPDNDPWNMSDMFRPFQTLLFKIRELLYTLSPEEMRTLERALCSAEEPSFLASLQPSMESVEGFSQTDFVQLHSDKAEGSSSFTDQLGGPILVHTPNSGSPVTPVAQSDFPVGSMSTSTSCATVIASSRQNSVEVEDAPVECLLNKSESNDSGLHSENVSTSDSITTVSSTESQHHELLDNTVTSSPVVGEGTLTRDEKDGSLNSLSEVAGCLGVEDNCDGGSLERCDESADVVRDICAETVEELVNAVIADSTSSSLSPSITSSLSPSVSSSLSPSHSSLSSKPDGETSSDSVSILSDSEGQGDSKNPSDIVSTNDSVTTSNTASIDPPKDLILSDSVNASDSANSRDSLNPSDTVCDASTEISTHSAIVTPVSLVTPSEHGLELSPSRDQSNMSVISSGDTVVSTQSQGNRLCSNTQDIPRKPKMYDRSTSTTEKGIKGSEMTPERSGFPSVSRLRYEESLSSSCSSCKSIGDQDWEKMSCASSETSSYNSECQDDEEIALAMQAAELASRNEARSRFRSSSDMIHRLFVCISGVADQLQTNFASDLRNILRAVFDMNCAELLIMADNKIEDIVEDEEEGGASSSNENSPTRLRGIVQRREESEAQTSEPNEPSTPSTDPPNWLPDEVSPLCMACRVPFTFVRRRHHCRNCGKIFCGRCSSNSVPLPHYGHAKPVRVCNRCFMFQVTPFTVATSSS